MSDPPYRVHHITESRVVDLIDNSLNKRDFLHREELRGVIASTVRETLLQLGMQVDSPTEMQQDFAHIRMWRKLWEAAGSKAFFGILAMLATMVVSLIVIGFRSWVGKN